MAKIGRPKSENVKKKVLSIRVEDSMYKCICDYARKHKMTVTEVVLQELKINTRKLHFDAENRSRNAYDSHVGYSERCF